MPDDGELLRRYAEAGDQDAFTELVRRNLDLVYAAALRQVQDTHLAEDIAQAVFTSLARQARQLCHRPVLLSWLYTAAHYTASNAKRERWRRMAREGEAALMHGEATAEAPAWDRMKPVFDAAMHDLGESDRAALLLRFFRGLSFAEVAVPLRITEDGARKRVDRALDKLRTRLARHGITSSAAALASVLSAQTVTPRAGLAERIAGNATTAAAVTAVRLSWTLSQKLTLAAAAVAILAIGLVWRKPPTAGASPRPDSVGVAPPASTPSSRLAASAPHLGASPLPESVGVAAPAFIAVPPPAAPKLSLPTGELPFAAGEMVRGFAPDFITAFRLTDSETTALQGAFRSALAEMDRLSAAHTHRALQPDGSLIVTIDPFPEGAGIRDAFLQAFASILGPDRWRIFSAHYSGAALSRELGSFGEMVRSVRITRGDSLAPRAPAFSFQEKTVGVTHGGAVDLFAQAWPLVTATFRDELQSLPPYTPAPLVRPADLPPPASDVISSSNSVVAFRPAGPLLADTFVRAFALTPTETRAIELAFRDARAELQTVATGIAYFTPELTAAGPRAKIVIEPFAEGENLKTELLRRIGAVLGPERQAVFAGHYLQTRALNFALSDFGQVSRSIRISRVGNGYSVTDQSERGGGTMSLSTGAYRGADAPEDLESALRRSGLLELVSPFLKPVKDLLDPPYPSP